METWGGIPIGLGCREDIYQCQRRVGGYKKYGAPWGKLSLADFGLLICSELVLALGDPHGLRFPKHSPRPRAARPAMAIFHGFGRSRRLQMNGSAKAFTRICCCHGRPLFEI